MVDDGTRSVVVGEFNNDGNSDLAVADLGAGSLEILLGDGQGRFCRRRYFRFRRLFARVRGSGDFNNDGNSDLAVVNRDSGSVGILLGDGQCGLAPATSFSSGALTPGPSSWGTSTTMARAIWLWRTGVVIGGNTLGRRAGRLCRRTTFDSAAITPTPVAVGDSTTMARAIWLCERGSDSVGIPLGRRTGGFAAVTTFNSGGSSPCSVAVGDLNNDGEKIWLWRMEERTLFEMGGLAYCWGMGLAACPRPRLSVPVALTPVPSIGGDFNNDGTRDLAVANGGSGSVAILSGDGQAVCGPCCFRFGGAAPACLAAGDLNNDGKWTWQRQR